MWGETLCGGFVSQKEMKMTLSGALRERNMLIERHVANSAADENGAVAAKVQGQKRRRENDFTWR